MEKLIDGFENYTVNENGVVRNVITGKIKHPTDNRSGGGYLYIDLHHMGTRARKYIHRLVAKAFIPNPHDLPIVNHIDGNPKNNRVENLEWCTALSNVEHASKVIKTMCSYEKANEKRKKAVYMLDRFTGQRVATFTSIRQASYWTNIPSSNIVACLKGRQKYTQKYTWQYAEEA